MDKIIENLEKLQAQIDESKTRKAQLEGRKSEQLNRLKELGLNSVKEGKKKLLDLEKELEALDANIKEKYRLLEENYEW